MPQDLPPAGGYGAVQYKVGCWPFPLDVEWTDWISCPVVQMGME